MHRAHQQEPRGHRQAECAFAGGRARAMREQRRRPSAATSLDSGRREHNTAASAGLQPAWLLSVQLLQSHQLMTLRAAAPLLSCRSVLASGMDQGRRKCQAAGRPRRDGLRHSGPRITDSAEQHIAMRMPLSCTSQCPAAAYRPCCPVTSWEGESGHAGPCRRTQTSSPRRAGNQLDTKCSGC